MGSFSSKTSSSTKPVYAPEIEGAAKSVQSAYDAAKPGLQAITNTVQGAIPGLAERAFNTDPTVTAAQGYAQDAIGGHYLNNNPYVDEQSRIARNNVGDNVNSYFGKVGRVGSGAHLADLGRGMSEAELGVRSGIYGQERQAQAQAAGMAPSLNAGQYAGISPFLGTAQAGAELPFVGSNNLASGIGGLLGQYTNTTGKTSTPWGAAWLNAAGSAASAAAGSDFRLKKNIEKIGEYDDGLGIYDFDYIDGLPANISAHCPQGRQRGVMADEVANIRPWALGPVIDGYATVDYGRL
jgi:hypothetical protein